MRAFEASSRRNITASSPPPESLGMVVLTWARERPDDHVVRLEWDGRDVGWSDEPVAGAPS